MIKKEILIDADVKKVWEIFCRIEDWPRWGVYIIDEEWASKDKWKVGSRFSQSIKGFYGFKKFRLNALVLEIIPFKSVTWKGTKPLVHGVHTFKFQKLGGKTKVTNMEYFKGPLAFIMYPFIKNKFGIYFEQFLNGLKEEAEK